MGIFIKIYTVPNSGEDLIEYDQWRKMYKIKIKERPEHNRANRYLISYLSRYLNVSENQIKIVKGVKSKEKTLYLEANVDLLETLKK